MQEQSTHIEATLAKTADTQAMFLGRMASKQQSNPNASLKSMHTSDDFMRLKGR